MTQIYWRKISNNLAVTIVTDKQLSAWHQLSYIFFSISHRFIASVFTLARWVIVCGHEVNVWVPLPRYLFPSVFRALFGIQRWFILSTESSKLTERKTFISIQTNLFHAFSSLPGCSFQHGCCLPTYNGFTVYLKTWIPHGFCFILWQCYIFLRNAVLDISRYAFL